MKCSTHWRWVVAVLAAVAAAAPAAMGQDTGETDAPEAVLGAGPHRYSDVSLDGWNGGRLLVHGFTTEGRWETRSLDPKSGELRPVHTVEGARPFAVSPSGKHYFTEGADGAIVLGGTTGSGKPVQLRGVKWSHRSRAAFSADGWTAVLALVVETGCDIHVLDLREGTSLALGQLEFEPEHLAVSPRGKVAAVVEGKQPILVFDLESGAVKARVGGATEDTEFRWPPQSPPHFTFSGDGKRLVEGTYDGALRVWDLSSQKTVAESRLGDGAVTALAADTRGDRVAAVLDASRICMATTAKGLRFSRESGHSLHDVALSPDGKHLVAKAGPGGLAAFASWDGKPAWGPTGHTSPIERVAWAADGAIVTACEEGRTARWDATTGQASTLVQPAAAVDPALGLKTALSADGSLFAWALADGSVHVLNTEDAKVRPVVAAATGDGARSVKGLWFGSSPRHLLVCDELASSLQDFRAPRETRVLLFDAAGGDGAPSRPLGEHAPWLADVSADGAFVAIGTTNSVEVWDPKTGKRLVKYRVDTTGLRGLALSEKGVRVASFSDRVKVHVHDVEGGERVAALDWGQPFRGRIWTDVVLTPFGFVKFVGGPRIIAVGAGGSVARLWDTVSSRVLWDVRLPAGARAATLGVSPDTKQLAIGLWDGRVLVYDLEGLGASKEIATALRLPKAKKDARGDPLPFGAVQRIRLRKSDEPPPANERDRRLRMMTTLCFSPDRTALAAGSGDGRVWLYDLAKGKVTRTLPAAEGVVTDLRFDREGAHLAAFVARFDAPRAERQQIIVWSVSSGRTVWTRKTPGSTGNLHAVAPDGGAVYVGQPGRIDEWGRAKPTVQRQLPIEDDDGPVRAITVSDDGKTLVAVQRSTVTVFDRDTGKPSTTITVGFEDKDQSGWSVAWLDRAGGILRGIDSGGRHVRWDLASKRRVHAGLGTVGGIERVAASAGAQVVATLGFGALLVRRFEDSEELLRVPGSVQELHRIGFDVSPDGKLLATGEKDGTILLWELNSDR